jgi:hypothetical protein
VELAACLVAPVAGLFKPGQSSQNGVMGSPLAWADRAPAILYLRGGGGDADGMDRSGLIWFGETPESDPLRSHAS